MTTVNFEQQVGNVVVNGILTKSVLKVKINGVDERMTEWSSKFDMTPLEMDEEGYMLFPIEQGTFECSFEEMAKELDNGFKCIAKELVAKALDSARVFLKDDKEFERIVEQVAYNKYSA